MSKTMKRTAVAALAGVMAAGMLSGCGAKELDGTKTVATVNETEIPMGVLSLYARQQQAQTAAMYMSFMGSAANIWDQTVDEESGETYGDQAVEDCMKAVELMCILKEKAADYGVEVTEEDEKAIAEAAAAFVKANDEETMKELAVTEEQVKTLLELQTYRARIYDPIVADANVEITDDEANQSSFTYINISTSREDLTEEDLKKREEQAQEILDKVKADPTADMDEIAKSVDETYTSLTGTFTTKKNEDEEDSYPAEVMEVLRKMSEGEVCTDVIDTENGYYIVRLDKALDEEATESKKESLKETKESEFYTETTDKWLEEADVKVDKKVLKTLKITDSHTFTIKAPEVEETAAEEDSVEDAELETDTTAAADETETDTTAEADETETDTTAEADETEADTAVEADETTEE